MNRYHGFALLWFVTFLGVVAYIVWGDGGMRSKALIVVLAIVLLTETVLALLAGRDANKLRLN